MRRRGTAVLLEFWLPLNPEGLTGRSNLDAHFDSTVPARMRAPTRGAHAVEFSKTAAPLLWRGFLRVRLPGRPLKGPPERAAESSASPRSLKPSGGRTVLCGGAQL